MRPLTTPYCNCSVLWKLKAKPWHLTLAFQVSGFTFSFDGSFGITLTLSLCSATGISQAGPGPGYHAWCVLLPSQHHQVAGRARFLEDLMANWWLQHFHGHGPWVFHCCCERCGGRIRFQCFLGITCRRISGCRDKSSWAMHSFGDGDLKIELTETFSWNSLVGTKEGWDQRGLRVLWLPMPGMLHSQWLLLCPLAMLMERSIWSSRGVVL